MTIEVVGPIVAAVTSVAGAVMAVVAWKSSKTEAEEARKSSKTAMEGARAIATLNHTVAALDEDASQFNEAFKIFISSLAADIYDKGAAANRLLAVKSIRINPYSSDVMKSAANSVNRNWKYHKLSRSDPTVKKFHQDVRIVETEFEQGAARIRRDRMTLIQGAPDDAVATENP